MFMLLNVLLVISLVNGARILGIVPTPSYSHNMVFKPLWKELSLRGHQVTTITAYPIKDSKLVNLTEIDMSHTSNNFDEFFENAAKGVDINPIEDIGLFYEEMRDVVDRYLEEPAVQSLIRDSDTKFDLVIGEYLFNSVFALATRFDCPSIGILSGDAWNAMYKMVGNPTHSSLYLDVLMPAGNQMTLLERVLSFLSMHMSTYIVDHMQTLEQEIVEKHFGNHYPTVQELSSNISLLFLDTDPIFHPIRPLVPAVIQIGAGSHRIPAKPIPQYLQNVLDSARNGFVYFSLGSNLKSKHLPSNIVNSFLSAFAELPFVVLWKFEDEDLPNKPENVIVSKWLPQQNILKHPNIKLFITQGGLQSMDEAIYEHVPMIGIPFFGDQPYNVKKMVSKGFGLELDHRTLEKEELKATILEVINNPKYRNTIKKLAELAQDQPMTGIEKAVWWTEYVIRHKGAKHLRSPLLDMPWYQYLLLDVIGVLVLTTLLIVCLVYFLIRKLVRLVKSHFLTKLLSREKKD